MGFVVWWPYIQSAQSYVGVSCMLVGSREHVIILMNNSRFCYLAKNAPKRQL
jgi:hypothetical protein